MPADQKITTLLLGDVYSDSGSRALFIKLNSLKKKYKADFVIVNGENACNGFGISVDNMTTLFGMGIDVLTSGNHIWQQEEIFPFLDSNPYILRPANYGSMVPGHGYTIKNGIGVINLQGRVNMPVTEDPFKWAADIVRQLKQNTKTIFVDFHAESCEEKEALGYFLDGEVTAVVGTHIHIRTNDERILPKGTAYITDLGICGPSESVIGCDRDLAIKRQMTQMPIKAQAADSAPVINGVCIVSDALTGKALNITGFSE